MARWQRPEQRPAATAEWLLLGVALVPILVAVIRAWATDWVPIGDNAYFMARSRDVLTGDHPFVGAWSIGSRTVGTTVNNLGPLQLDLLAPFTKLEPYNGAALGAAAINAAAVVGVWFVARRLFGTVGVVAAMFGTVMLELAIGNLGLLEARQQLALLLPFWCLLWLVTALASGDVRVLPWLVAVASVVLQTHFSYVYVTGAVLAAGAIGVVVVAVRHDQLRSPTTVRATAIAIVVGIVCWSQTLWDQLFGRGNLLAVARQGSEGSGGVGFGTGTRLVADSTLTPPFLLPSSFRDFSRLETLTSPTWAVVTIGIWVVALAAVLVGAIRAGRRRITAMAAVSIVALGSALFAGGRIPPGWQTGIMPQNYFWMWPIGMFLAMTVAAGILAAAMATWPDVTRSVDDARVPWVAAGIMALVCVPASLPHIGWAKFDHEDQLAREVARPLVAGLSAGLDRHDIDDPVVVHIKRGTIKYRYTILAELQRHGIEFTYQPDTANVARFGPDRCESRDSAQRLFVVDGPSVREPLPDGAVVLARVTAITPGERDELAALNRRVGDLLRSDTIRFDLDAGAQQGLRPPRRLERLLATADQPATGFQPAVKHWHNRGALTIPDQHVDAIERWNELHSWSIHSRAMVYLTPPMAVQGACDPSE